MLQTGLILILIFNSIKCHPNLKQCSLDLNACIRYRFVDKLDSYICFECQSIQCPCMLSPLYFIISHSSRNVGFQRNTRNYWLSAIVGICLVIIFIVFFVCIILSIQFHLNKRRQGRYVVNGSGFSQARDLNSSRVWFTSNTETTPPDYNNVKFDSKNSNSSDFLPPYTTIS